VNPLNLIKEFLDSEVIEISRKLEEGILDYKGNEKQVKYETFYEKLASVKRMTAVLHEGYWTDLGTEDKIQAAEQDLPSFFTESSD
jgi:NDP-sugar pyrophosphorylase family protein